MFCPKCGTHVLDDAGFCQKCGTKIVYEGTASKAPDTHTAKPLPETPTVSNTVGDGSNFKAFVDNHVRAFTQFQSAEELLNNKVSLQFVWICLGISCVIGLFMLPILPFALLLGYAAANIAGGLKRGRYAFKYNGKFTAAMDIDGLIQYLNQYLKSYPCFHDWGRMKLVGSGVQGKAATAVSTSVAESLNEISICTPFGEDQRMLSVIYIRPDVSSGQLKYSFGSTSRLVDGEPFSAQNTGFDFTFSRYKCLVKTAPILQAAMEYYLKYYTA